MEKQLVFLMNSRVKHCIRKYNINASFHVMSIFCRRNIRKFHQRFMGKMYETHIHTHRHTNTNTFNVRLHFGAAEAFAWFSVYNSQVLLFAVA